MPSMTFMWMQRILTQVPMFEQQILCMLRQIATSVISISVDRKTRLLCSVSSFTSVIEEVAI